MVERPQVNVDVAEARAGGMFVVELPRLSGDDGPVGCTIGVREGGFFGVTFHQKQAAPISTQVVRDRLSRC